MKKELEIEIITDDSSSDFNESHIQSQTMEDTGMKVVLASNATLLRDVRMYLKTAKYEMQSGCATRPQVARILRENQCKMLYARRT